MQKEVDRERKIKRKRGGKKIEKRKIQKERIRKRELRTER
jgi:hypothetical protein